MAYSFLWPLIAFLVSIGFYSVFASVNIGSLFMKVTHAGGASSVENPGAETEVGGYGQLIIT